MDRNDVLALMSGAASPNDIASAFAEARAWLADNPQDDDVRAAVQALARREREQWGLTYR